jgi:hypothetical protein
MVKSSRRRPIGLKKTKVEKLAAFLLILILCNFLELMRCHMRIGYCKLGGLQTDRAIGAL